MTLLYINIDNMYSYLKSTYFPKPKKKKKKNYWKTDIILHFCKSLLISGLIKTAEFSLLLYSICCDILILIKNIKKSGLTQKCSRKRQKHFNSHLR